MDIQNMFAERIGGNQFGINNEIYKFALIKEWKRNAQSKFKDIMPLIDMGVGEPDIGADSSVVELLSSEARKPENRFYADNGIEEFRVSALQYMKKVFNVGNLTTNNILHGIGSKQNIILAYRNICKNNGSKTPGTDGKTIVEIQELPIEMVIKTIRNKLNYYQPKKVIRVEIPKDNGKTRPLGIPSIWDRLIQQCVLQVLEPICEAKFHERNNGFRPYRSTQNAIAQCYKMAQIQNLHFVVDIDITGFFDNIDHSKLIRQLWGLGIQDRKLIMIIKQMRLLIERCKISCNKRF